MKNFRLTRRRALQMGGSALALGAAGLPGRALAQEDGRLLVWDQFSDSPSYEMFEHLVQAFRDANPGAEVSRQNQSQEQLVTIASTALSSGTGPDILQYSVGRGNAGLLADAGLLLPLDDYAEQYGWHDRLIPVAIKEAELGGRLYGGPQEAEVTNFFVNKTLMDQHELEMPETFEDFVQLARDARARDLLLLAYGEGSFWPSWWSLSHVASNVLGAQGSADLVFDNIGRYDTPEMIDGIEQFWVELREAGAFIPQVNALSYPDALALFISGGALMLMSGTWAAGTIDESMPDAEIEIMPWPSIDGRPRVYPNGVGSALYISAQSQNPDLAAAFIDHLYSDESVVYMSENSGIIPPVEFDPSELNLSPFQMRSITSVATGDGDADINSGAFVNHGLAGAEFLRMMTNGFQAMMAGEKTSAQQAADLQAAWDADQE